MYRLSRLFMGRAPGRKPLLSILLTCLVNNNPNIGRYSCQRISGDFGGLGSYLDWPKHLNLNHGNGQGSTSQGGHLRGLTKTAFFRNYRAMKIANGRQSARTQPMHCLVKHSSIMELTTQGQGNCWRGNTQNDLTSRGCLLYLELCRWRRSPAGGKRFKFRLALN